MLLPLIVKLIGSIAPFFESLKINTCLPKFIKTVIMTTYKTTIYYIIEFSKESVIEIFFNKI